MLVLEEMKRTYASGAEKIKILDKKKKVLVGLPKVTSFFGPASVALTLQRLNPRRRMLAKVQIRLQLKLRQ